MRKRDSAYYLGRIEREFPDIFADYTAGVYRSVSEAARAAGLKRTRTALHELLNAWKKASAAERQAFIRALKSGATAAPARSTGTAVAVNRHLQPWARRRISAIMTARNLESGDVMAEMGFPRLNVSLARAILRGSRITPGMITALERWLEKNALVK